MASLAPGPALGYDYVHERGKLRKALEGRSGARRWRLSTAVEAAPCRGSRRATVRSWTASSPLFPGAAGPRLFSTPGRTEVCGNHTDHNHGKVLAAAIDLDVIAVAAPAADGRITIESEGYPRQEVSVDDLDPRESERSTAPAITRGVASRMRSLGHAVGGFCACVTSDVLKGSGLSSSASYEVLVATILNRLYNAGRIDGQEIALIGQFSENEYFGKPSGLMDQTTCALGGFITIDFQDPSRPRVRGVRSEFAGSGYVPVVVDTGGSHADLTDEYAAVKEEMKERGPAPRRLGPSRHLAGTRPGRAAGAARGARGPRRSCAPCTSSRTTTAWTCRSRRWKPARCGRFLELVRESGRSSWMLLQNCYPARHAARAGRAACPGAQPVPPGRRTARGGSTAAGSPGTILAFVPETDSCTTYLSGMRAGLRPRLLPRPFHPVRGRRDAGRVAAPYVSSRP